MPEHQAHLNSSAPAADAPPTRLGGTVFFIICATLVFSVVAFGAVDIWALGALSFLSGLIAVLWLADSWYRKEFRFSSNPLQIPLLGLIVIGLVQLLPLRSPEAAANLLSIPATASLSLAPYSTRLATVQLIVYFVFYAAALTHINSLERLRKIIAVVVIFAALTAFFGILQRLANLEAIYGVRPSGQAIPFASFINQHHFAAFMEMTIGLTLGLLFDRTATNNRRVLLIFAASLMGIAIVLTGSRGGMLSLLAVIGFLAATKIFQKPSADANSSGAQGGGYRRVLAFGGAGFGLLIFLFAAVLLLGGDESLLRGVGLGNEADISSGRSHFWSIAWKIFLDHPLLGTGLDSFAFAYTGYDTWNGAFRVEQAHNDYLQILADAGIAGFICAWAFIILLFRQGLRLVRQSTDSFRRNAAVGALAGCAGILIHSFFDFPLRTPANALFFLTLTILIVAPIAAASPFRKRGKKSISRNQ